MKADIKIEGRGFYTLTADDSKGLDWIGSNVNVPEDCDGPIYSDDTGYMMDIAEAATADGLTVAVNGYLYVAGGLRGEAVA